MKLLMLGGTIFLGRHIAQAAREAGHELTLFNRGKSGPDLFPDLEKLIGDRNGDLHALKGRQWDAVIDTCGCMDNMHKVVGASAGLLRGQAGHYTFISSVSVYKDSTVRNQDETSEVGTMPEKELSKCIPETYGALKAASEKVVARNFPDKSLIIRPGLIAGPFDPTDRFTYWPARLLRGGEVLAPGNPNRLVQLIDARDLAQWIVGMIANRETGTYNACGAPTPLERLLNICRNTAAASARFTWVCDEFLLQHKVVPYTEMPLWIPNIDDSFAIAQAQAKGLNCRPIQETVQDILAWDSTRPKNKARLNGLAESREVEILKSWNQRKLPAAV